MKNTLALFSALMKERLRSKGAGFGRKIGQCLKGGKHLVFWGILALCFLPMLLLLATFFYKLGGAFAQTTESLTLFTDALSTLITFGQVAVLAVGLASLVTTVYHGDDNEMLMALPLKPSEIFAAKLMCVYVFEFGTSLLITLFAMLPLGMGFGAGAGFYFGLVFTALLLPVFPMLIATILGIPVMYIVSALKGKSQIAVAVMCVGFALLFLGYYYLIYKVMPNFDGMSMSEIAEAFSGLVRSVGEAFFPSLVSAKFLSAESAGSFFINLLITVGTDALLFLCAVALASKVYKKILSGGLETRGKTGSKGKIAYGSLKKELISRDFKTVTRYSSMGFYCFLQVVMSAVLPLVLLLIKGNAGVQNLSRDFVFFAGTTLLTFFESSNVVATGAFSREGKDMALMKTLPLSPKDIITAKLLLAYAFDLVSVVLSAVVLGIILKANVLIVFVGIIAGFVSRIAGSAVSVYNDMKRPCFVWRTPAEGLKNAPGALAGMICGFITLLIWGAFVAVGFVVSGGFSGITFGLIAYGGYIVCMGVIAFLAVRKLFSKADGLYYAMEV